MKTLTILMKRALRLGLLAFTVTSATFFLVSLIPGDFFTALEANPNIRPETVTRLREEYGLGDPVYLQYVHWVERSLHLDFGYSLFYGSAVSSVVGNALPNTLWMGVPALLLGCVAGAILGTFHAVHQQRPAGYLLDFLSAVTLSLPPLILGLAALMFASGTQWFPVGGMSAVSLESPHPLAWILDRLHHLALPVACIGLPVTAIVEKIQYAAAKNTLVQLHVRSARARGLSRRRILLMHVLLPSLNPVLSVFGPLLGAVLSGSLVLETIFSWPGLGKATYDALFNTDIYLLLGCVACGGVLLALGNLVADLLLFLLDPRTRHFSNEAF